jgi:hypothetical protein
MAFMADARFAALLNEPVDSWGVAYDFDYHHIIDDVADGWHNHSGTAPPSPIWKLRGKIAQCVDAESGRARLVFGQIHRVIL